MKRTAAVIACSLTLITAAPREVTIAEASRQTLEKNSKIEQYRFKYSQKEWDQRGTLANFLPTVSITAGVTQLDNPIVLNLDPIREAMIGSDAMIYTKMFTDSLVRATGGKLTPQQYESYSQAYRAGASEKLNSAIPHFIDTVKEEFYPSASVTVTQPIFAGGKIIASRKAGSAEKSSAQYELKRIENETVQEVWNSYWGCAVLAQAVEVRRDVLAGMNRHVRDASKLAASGMIAKSSLLRAEAAAAEARRALADDSCRYLLAQLSLARTMNDPRGSLIVPADSMPAVGSFPIDRLNSDTISDNQPILSQISAKKELAHAKSTAERGGLMPKAAVWGKAELITDYLSVLDPKWAVGLSGTVEITGGKNIAKYQSAKNLEREADAAYRSAQRDIALWAEKAYIEAVSAENKYKKLETDAAQASENLRQCESRFAEGYGTSMEVEDAQLLLAKVRIERITAQYDYCRAVMDLYTAQGKTDQCIIETANNQKKIDGAAQ